MSSLDALESFVKQIEFKQWVVIIIPIFLCLISIYVVVRKPRPVSKGTETLTQQIIRTPKRYTSKQQSPPLLSPLAPPNTSYNDDAFESDILSELDRYNATKGEKRDIEGLTASLISASTNSGNGICDDQFEKIKSLEQELSNQKLLNHYTEIRLKKKEKECEEIQKSEKLARNKVRQLLEEISSISKKNKDLMTYCENKVASCKIEYDKISQQTFDTVQKKKECENEIADLKNKLSENTIYKTECSKLRANVSCLKSQTRESNKEMDILKDANKGLKDTIDTQKHRLNESSKHFNKLSDDLVTSKHENKRQKNIIKEYRDKMNELEMFNQELNKENRDTKNQMDQFFKQLKKHSLVRNDITDVQQRLGNKERLPLLVSSSDNGKIRADIRDS